jgi:hypothetical protein
VEPRPMRCALVTHQPRQTNRAHSQRRREY